jgi:hypothetical protein
VNARRANLGRGTRFITPHATQSGSGSLGPREMGESMKSYRNYFHVATVLALLASLCVMCAAADATDYVVPTTVMLVKPGQLVKFLGKCLPSGDLFSFQWPSSVTFTTDTGSVTHQFSISALGGPHGPATLLFKDGICRAKIKYDIGQVCGAGSHILKLKIKCSDTGTISLPVDHVDLIYHFDNNTTDNYCSSCSSSSSDRKYKQKNCIAPVTCGP